MITVQSAQQLVIANCSQMPVQSLPLNRTLGYVTANDIQSPIPLPCFDNAAMDGFVIRSNDTQTPPTVLTIQATIQAGDIHRQTLNPGEAFRIMTGAPIPVGGDTILMKEHAVTSGNQLILHQPIPQGMHIRKAGEEIAQNAIAIKAHTLINPGTIGFLASLGISSLNVFTKPKVSVITTGNELIMPGKSLRFGQIYNSNSSMLKAVLRQMGITPVLNRSYRDTIPPLRKGIVRAIENSHIVIIVGGISVGDYDLVKDILKDVGVQEIFWRVSQKPGKPIFSGYRAMGSQKTLVFGLPGNPASAYICFYEYVYPAIRKMMGLSTPFLEEAPLRLNRHIDAEPNKTRFLKGKRNGKDASVLEKQGSHMVSSLSEMDCFIAIPPHTERVDEGAEVTVHLLPY